MLLLLAVACVASLPLVVHPWYDATNDGSSYIVTARSIAAGEGYRYLGAPFRVRPPGFAALLAPVLLLRGLDFLALNLTVAAFGVAAVCLLFLHQRERVGVPLALLTAAAVWLNPGYERLCSQVMADVPGLALLVACLLLERWASLRPSLAREVVLGLAIGLACHVRAQLVLLVPAIAVARWLARSGAEPRSASIARRLLPFTATTGLVLLPWIVSVQRSAPVPPADQTLNYTIGTAMWHEDPGDPRSRRLGVTEILARVPRNVDALGLVLGSRMALRVPGSPWPGPAARWAYRGVALMMLGCLLHVLLRRRAPAELFAAGTLVVVAVYFVFTDRLALPLYVLALAATVETLARVLGSRLGSDRAATALTAAALLILTLADLGPRREWESIERRHRSFVETAAAVGASLAPDARLAAGQGLHHSVYLERPVYNLALAVRRAGRADAAEEVIDRYALNTVVLSALVPQDAQLGEYFSRRYGPGVPAGTARVWRVRP